ncbi:MAG: Lrp/AsnC family transcriptional regulator [Anaerolineae bacterium]|nr:Lrp/AsnC family transcriptional regulator [Anaerolineae bacterium]
MSKPFQSNVDSTDWAILRELQENARISYAELGRRVGLTSPAVQERVRRLEDAGIIQGYHASVNPERLGLPIQVLIRLEGECRNKEHVVAELYKIPQIVHAYHVLGDDCFVLVAVLPDMASLKPLLKQLYEYGETVTTVVLDNPIAQRCITPETRYLTTEDRDGIS